MARKLRLGILTGGGDCPGLNAVIRAVVRAASETHPADILGIEDGYEGLIHPGRTQRLTLERVRGILPRGGTILGANNRANPFAYLDERGKRVDVSDRVLRRLRALRLDGLLLVGGDGTLRIGHELAALGVRVVCIPKTIDNDIRATEVTFGFDTALQTAMWALDKLHTTAESHDRVMILEVMGRSAGWIALYAGVAGGAHAIAIPEIPYRVTAIAEVIHARTAKHKRFSIVVVAEGAKPAGGRPSVLGVDAQGFPRYGGAGDQLAAKLRKLIDHEVRVTVLGHLQRGGSPSALDRILGSRFGVGAVELAARGEWNTMVALRAGEIVAVPLRDALGTRLVDPQSDVCRTARALGITFG
jgi:6-phosphofructokinase 1